MSKLGIEQKSVKLLLSDNKADFLIPDYQRPYAWEEKECQTLWDDIFSFAFPDNDCDKFDRHNDEYFLGPIVTFLNEDKKREVIDGQQRLTTLMLLLRAFYDRYGNMQDELSITTRKNIEQCIWKTDEFDKPDMSSLKLESEVATDDAKQELKEILRTGEVNDNQKSQYAQNYRFFQKKINQFLVDYPSYFAYLPTRILNNCILLPIEAESQDTALRIFSTLNDRGKPLSDSDIFKAQFYKYFSKLGEKDYFIENWKELEYLCNSIFHPLSGTPMDELFTRYMYYERAKQGIKSTTTEALRKFYEKDKYALLKKKQTFENLIDLAKFWNDVLNQNVDRFSDDILKRLFVLNYAPNGMWTYFVSVYYMANKHNNGLLDDKPFYDFLCKITAFIWSYAITNPGVSALRAPVFVEMINLVNHYSVDFYEYRFSKSLLISYLKTYTFSNSRALTKSMLAWWAFHDNEQKLLSLEVAFETEHIYARNRSAREHSSKRNVDIDSIGNKVLLEKRINIRSSDYRFIDKTKYYLGFTNARGQVKEGTNVKELIDMAHNITDFTEKDINDRKKRMLSEFILFVEKNNLFYF